MSQLRRILVAHPWMGRGGSEATAMWTLQTLADRPDDYDITFVTASEVVWKDLNARYGTSLDGSQIHVLRVTRLPGVRRPEQLAYLQRAWFERSCYHLSREFDICISAYNPIYFQKPGIQLIGDFSFSEPMRKRLRNWPGQPRLHRNSLLRCLYLSLTKWIGVTTPPLAERGDLVVANSAWTAGLLQKYFCIDGAPVIWPPVRVEVLPNDPVQDPWRFACLGRISPEKEIERIIRILAAVRELDYPVTLELIGEFDDSEYSQFIRTMASAHHWINLAGFLDQDAKLTLLATCTYAVHACRIEAFGIAVAEMVSQGCLVVIPDSGGAREIVPMAELQFGCESEAVSKIITLLRNPSHGRELQSILRARVAKMGGTRFSEELLKLVLAHRGANELANRIISPELSAEVSPASKPDNPLLRVEGMTPSTAPWSAA